MLKVDPTLDHVPARKEHVIALYESINQPLVNIPKFGTASTGAFVLGTRNDQGAFTAFVYLYQPETRATVVYVSEPRALTLEQYRREEQEAIRFVESMGFMVDNVHFPTLAPPEQETVMGRIPMFRPPKAPEAQFDPAPSASDPFGTDQLDAIFGGLSDSDANAFRSGMPAPASQRPSGSGSFPSVPRSNPTAPPPFQVHQGGSALPETTRPGAPPGGDAFATSPGMSSPPPLNSAFSSQPNLSVPPPAAATQPPVTNPAPTSNPAGATNPPAHSKVPGPDAAALERLGRLLGLFTILLVCLLGLPRCKTTGPTAPPEAVNSQVDIGTQHLAQGAYAEAIRAFQVALDMDDQHRDALRGTALAYRQLGILDESEKFYRASIEVAPDWSIPKNELAVVLLQTRRCEEAKPLLEAVLKDIFYPTPQFADHNLAKAMACLGDTEGAIDRLEKLVLKYPKFCLGYLTLAQMSAELKRHETVISSCDDFVYQCLEDDAIKKFVPAEDSDLCYLRKGLAYAELGDLESARASFSRCQSRGQLGKECKKSLEMLPP
ncbi:MAG: tetratricopeptide repeat protein [Deltaproteobacteria bacterium]|jgi:Tfp pilus assembly protein PilF